MGKRGNQAATQFLIHWKAHSPFDATWDFADDFKLRFPNFNLEDMVALKESTLSNV
jgi:hypothetical protein